MFDTVRKIFDNIIRKRRSENSPLPSIRDTLLSSGLFNADWYTFTYPDVLQHSGDALDHYIVHGAAEGRAAGPQFDTRAYLVANEDVAASGINPLLHYIQHGVAEGRNFSRPTESGTIDIFDDHAVAVAAQAYPAEITWRFDPEQLTPCCSSGARILIELIRRRPDLRIRFPNAFRDGRNGKFAAWAKTEGLRSLNLAPLFAASIDDAFSANIGANARNFLCFDERLRSLSQLFLLPSESKEVLSTLFSASKKGCLSLEEVWWFVITQSEDLQAGLCEIWAMSPSWQEKFPDGGTIFGILDLAKWVSENLGCRNDAIFTQNYPRFLSDAEQVKLAYYARPSWQRRFPKATTNQSEASDLLSFIATRAAGGNFLSRSWVLEKQSESLARSISQPGINILGHFAYPSGLRSSVEAIANQIIANGMACSMRNVPVSLKTDEITKGHLLGMETHDITMIHIQPEPFFKEVYSRAGLLERRDTTYRIAYWYWEFDEVPSSWNFAAAQCDEIWTATEFIASGLRQRFRQPIKVLPPGIELPIFEKMPRSAFDLKDDEFIFLFTFHMTSVMDRKNPLGLIEAFKEEFGGDPRARLVVKTSFGNSNPLSFDELLDAAKGGNITIIDEVYEREKILSLIAASDVYVSLHRAEGLGLSMAEAMLLGRPVIATRFSGNLDFMNDDNSLLVNCNIVEIKEDIPPYKAGQKWAEPSIAHARQQMRRVFEQPDLVRELGHKGRIFLEGNFSPSAAGRAITDRLSQIDTSRA